MSDAWLAQATKLLLAHVGPIAKVMVRRAAERSRVREVLIAALAAAVPDSHRTKLLDELHKLG